MAVLALYLRVSAENTDMWHFLSLCCSPLELGNLCYFHGSLKIKSLACIEKNTKVLELH